MTDGNLWIACIAALITLVVGCVWVAITAPLGVLLGRATAKHQADDTDYGPRALWGPLDEYPATVAHIAHHAATDIDAEWSRYADGYWGDWDAADDAADDRTDRERRDAS